MADIISMEEKRRPLDNTRGAGDRKRKTLAAQKVLRCIHCRLKCEKCGDQIDAPPPRAGQAIKLRVPYKLCGSCTEEYIDYIERLKGGGDTGCYWRNDSWLESWQRWIDYRGAVDRFVQSKEFLRLLKELRETTPQ